MSNCEVSIKCFNVVFILVEPVSVVYLGDVVGNNGPGFINVKVYLEVVEIASDNNDFSLPVSEGLVVVLVADGDSCEEGQVWQRKV